LIREGTAGFALRPTGAPEFDGAFLETLRVGADI